MTDLTPTPIIDPADIKPGGLGVNRRRFMATAGAISAAAFLAACGGSDDDDAADDTTTTAAPAATTTTAAEAETTTTAPAEEEDPEEGGRNAENDLKLGAFAASLEVLAVGTYGAALDAATSGALGEVPPAVAEFVTVAMAHHEAHLGRWNEILTANDMEEVTEPPEDLKATVDAEFAKVTDVAGAAKLALMLEQIAAATYLAVIPELATTDPIRLAASIQPIDMQHVAVLLFALGEYPVPDTFAKSDMAAMPA